MSEQVNRDMGPGVACKHCQRKFASTRGLAVHIGRWKCGKSKLFQKKSMIVDEDTSAGPSRIVDEEISFGIECVCCFVEFDFTELAQCTEGHLVCVSCLNGYIKEALYGQGKLNFLCMSSDGCSAVYPESELRRCLDEQTIKKMEEVITESELQKVQFQDICRCPHCDYRGLMSPGFRFLECPNESCGKVTCRHCQLDWNEHYGKECKELEGKDETALRKKYEEKMTEARLRTCIGCKVQFTKDSGCNKMTCRCGKKMCYVCRMPNIDYDHFCRHFREVPGTPCDKCTQCLLFSSTEEDENQAILEIQQEAEKEKKELGFNHNSTVGVPAQLEGNNVIRLDDTPVRPLHPVRAYPVPHQRPGPINPVLQQRPDPINPVLQQRPDPVNPVLQQRPDPVNPVLQQRPDPVNPFLLQRPDHVNLVQQPDPINHVGLFRQAFQRFNHGPQPFNHGPQPFNHGPQPFNHGPQPFNQDPQPNNGIHEVQLRRPFFRF